MGPKSSAAPKNPVLWIALVLAASGTLVLTVTGCNDPGISAPTVKPGAAVTRFSHAHIDSDCVSCHKQARPMGLVGRHGFNHARAGQGDCVTCHNTSIGKSWSDGVFGHTPMPTTCTECHASERPAGPVGPDEFTHATDGGTGDCVHCHSANIGKKWQGSYFVHVPTPAACAECHTPAKPKKPVGEGGKMNHDYAALPDCVTCHADTAGSDWSGAKFGHSPTPVSCEICHSGQRPTGPTGGTPTTPPFDHALRGTGDCVHCHASKVENIGKTWVGGHMRHKDLTSCLPCHESDRPKTVAVPSGEPPVADHYAGQNCFACHQTPSKGVKPFAFLHTQGTHAAISTCNNCHQQSGVKKHGPDVKDCNQCHVGTDDWRKLVKP